MKTIDFVLIVLVSVFQLTLCAPTLLSDTYSSEYVVEDGDKYLVIDDMLIRQNPERAGHTNQAWPNGVVPYSFDSSITAAQRMDIMTAINTITKTIPCVIFRPLRTSDNYNLHYNNNKTLGGCSSKVGWQNKRNQFVQLSTTCTIGNIVHETIHALGFFHEQTRNDRDKYVTINFENIIEMHKFNFIKNNELDTKPTTSYYGVKYNFDSIMHYGKNYFSVNGKNTIDVKNNTNALGNGNNIGQRDHISSGDEQMIRAKYNCPAEAGNGDEEENCDEGRCDEAPMWEEKSTTKNPKCEEDPTLPECRGEQ